MYRCIALLALIAVASAAPIRVPLTHKPKTAAQFKNMMKWRAEAAQNLAASNGTARTLQESGAARPVASAPGSRMRFVRL